MIKKIPYGIANYEMLKEGNYYFVDKTKYIEVLENLNSRYLFFLRPRRFGKSLFISILNYYYDINSKDKFEILFKDTYIGKHPTELRNTLPVLKLNFSGIPVHGSMDEIEKAFNIHIRNSIRSFLNSYKNHFTRLKDIEREILSMDNGSVMISSLISYLDDLSINYYLLIDEYDNFANNILIEYGKDEYRKITHSGGFLRSFFAVIKNGTENRVIDRMFVTGVSPLVLSDVTSGMNIGDNISTRPIFNSMVGFTEKEKEEMIEYYIREGKIDKKDKESIELIFKEYYNNYIFSPENGERIHNSDMVLYFINNYIDYKKIPPELIDPNIRTDYGKLRFLVIENNRLNGNFTVLNEFIEKGESSGSLITLFSIGELIDKDKFLSLLYYLGLITIKELLPGNLYKYEIPNQTVRTLLWEYIRKSVNETYGLRIDTNYLLRQFLKLGFEGEWKELFSFVFDEFYKAASIRDFIWREEGIKMFFLAYTSMTEVYIVESEPELNKGYGDIYFRKNWYQAEEIKYEYLIEIKYIKSSEIKGKDRGKVIERKKEEAKEQLERYEKTIDERYNRRVPVFAKGKKAPELKKIIVIASSKKIEYMGEA